MLLAVSSPCTWATLNVWLINQIEHLNDPCSAAMRAFAIITIVTFHALKTRDSIYFVNSMESQRQSHCRMPTLTECQEIAMFMQWYVVAFWMTQFGRTHQSDLIGAFRLRLMHGLGGLDWPSLTLIQISRRALFKWQIYQNDATFGRSYCYQLWNNPPGLRSAIPKCQWRPRTTRTEKRLTFYLQQLAAREEIQSHPAFCQRQTVNSAKT